MFLLIGCAPSTQSLIEQAQLTGDWSLVDKRHEAIDRREEQRPQSCPRGTTVWCENRIGEKSCGCVKNADVERMLDSLRY